MKITKLINFVFLALIVGSFTMISCEGPAGPAGANGNDGIDGNAVCLTCHNAANKAAITDAYETSIHATGSTAARGSNITCAKCHCNEGYIETCLTGADTTKVSLPVLTRITCGTCHDFHASFDFENDGPDYAIRNNDPISLQAYGHTVSIDFGNNSNVCGYCHQPRTLYSYPFAADSFNITSSHWGPHHGPQATMVYGIGGCEIPGSKAYPTPGGTTHFTGAGCVTCHMNKGTDVAVGGHTWWPSVESCTPCHTGATNFDIDGVQTEVEDLLAELKTLLIGKGVLNADGGLITGMHTSAEAGAFFNYVTAEEEDKSFGVHNPDYIIALLTNSIEALQ